MGAEPAKKTDGMPIEHDGKIVHLDSFRSVDELVKRLADSSTPEDFATTAQAFANDYQTAIDLVRRLVKENQELTGKVQGYESGESERLKELQRKHQELKKELAYVLATKTKDELTGLHRRIVANIQGPELIELADRENQPFTVAMIDIDHFKEYNDTYGHLQGDEALKTVANVLRNKSRKADIVVRWGGEELLLLLPGTDHEGAKEHLEKIRENIKRTIVPTIQDKSALKSKDGNHKYVTVSVGMFTYDNSLNQVLGFNNGQDTDKLSVLMGYADKALYEAKESGRNRLSIGKTE